MQTLTLPEFADRINSVFQVLFRTFIKRQTGQFYKMKVTFPQFALLNILNQQGESRMTDMAKAMAVTTAAMTGISDRLVRSGYVVRVYDPNDRRIVKIRLTGKGSGLVKKMIAARRKMIVETFGKVSQKDRDDYLRVLMKVKDILLKEKEK